MKYLPLLIATLAIPVGIVSAQTPAATTSGQAPFIPLFSSAGNSGNNGGSSTTTATPVGNSTWYIDTTRNLVVFCVQTGGGATGGSPDFTCNAQGVPAAATTPPSGG